MIIVRSYLREIAVVYLITFAILVGVFAVEKFDYIARLAIDYRLDPRGFGILFIAELPSIMDLILPIATLVAIYVAVLAIRERREFIILAAAGAGSGPMLQVTLSVACLAAAVSILVSGFVKPVATYAFRQQYERSLTELISKGPEGGRFFQSKDMVVYTAKGGTSNDRKLRVFGFEGGRASYVYLSDCARMHVDAGRLYTDSCATHAYAFSPPADFDPKTSPGQMLPTQCPNCNDERARLGVVYLEGQRTQVPFDMKALFPSIDRDRIDEMNIFELLRIEGGAFASPESAQRGVKALVLAATNVLAVVCGLLAVAFTTLRTRFVALPLAAAALLGSVVGVGSGGALPSGAFTPLGAAGVVSLAFVAGFAALAGAVRAYRDYLAAPRMKRA